MISLRRDASDSGNGAASCHETVAEAKWDCVKHNNAMVVVFTLGVRQECWLREGN